MTLMTAVPLPKRPRADGAAGPGGGAGRSGGGGAAGGRERRAAAAGGGVGAAVVAARPVERRDAIRGMELGRTVDVSVGNLFVLEVDSQDAELPELVGDVLPGVRDRSVRPHEDLVGVLHALELRRAFERHDPAARVLAFRLESHGARRLQELEGLHPEAAREDVALAWQEVVGDAHALHREEVAAHDRLGEAPGESRFWVK